VYAAGLQDYHGAKLVLQKLLETVSSLEKPWADGISKKADWSTGFAIRPFRGISRGERR
jgi:hypothetical protein